MRQGELLEAVEIGGIRKPNSQIVRLVVTVILTAKVIQRRANAEAQLERCGTAGDGDACSDARATCRADARRLQPHAKHVGVRHVHLHVAVQRVLECVDHLRGKEVSDAGEAAVALAYEQVARVELQHHFRAIEARVDRLAHIADQ